MLGAWARPPAGGASRPGVQCRSRFLIRRASRDGRQVRAGRDDLHAGRHLRGCPVHPDGRRQTVGAVEDRTGGVVAMLGPGDFFGEAVPGGPGAPQGQRHGPDPERDPAHRQGSDGAAAAGAACDVRSVHLAHAVAQHPDRRGPDRSALQFEREAAGARAVAAGALRQRGQAGPRGADDLGRRRSRRWSARRARA